MSDPTFHHPSPLHIGELQLETPLGRGGMGEVWQARHISRNLRAAVKVVHTDTPRLKASILDEIRAIASLSHPNIITLYDWGEVRAADAQASEGRLIAGSPYLVMELLAGGDLVSRRAGLRWDDLKAVLLSLLSALGHAHARGIIHCDVKPSNILLDDLALSALRLSDFGIASRRTADPQQLRGSPGFIAPERLKSHQAPVQPQTDLYSVGCLAHLLATGSPPFLGDDAAHLAYQHFYVPPPVLPPHPGVPDGFAAWVLRLLQKSPVDRFPSTAAAATMLQQLGAPEDPTRIVHVVLPDPPSSATMTAPLPDGVSGQMAGTMSSTPPLCPVPGVRIPSQWRRVAAFAERRALPWVGAGLRLFTLRNVPLVGREIERDQLWRVLCTAINERATRVVLLEGEPGVGCSRLASWLALRAAEEGVVHHTLHFERGGDGWSQLVRQLMGLKPQPRQSLMHVTVWLKARGVHGPEDAALLAELIDAHATEPPTGAQRALLRRILQIACADQPTVLQLEDVHQTPGVCRWVSSILEKHDDLPVLFILTVKPGTHQDEIRALGAQKEVFHLPVPPLRQRAHQRLLQEFLWLDGDLVPRLEALTRGEPGFAIGLVAEWIAQGWLIPSPNGLKLGPDASDVLPRSMAQVWTQRLDRIFAERGADHAIAMERAALLGDVVTASQWEAACADLNVEHEALWRALSDNQLVVARGAAWWAFSTAQLRMILQQRMKDMGRWEANNRACAQAISEVAESDEDHLLLGQLLIAGGDHELGITLLLKTIRERYIDTAPQGEWALLDLVDATLDQIQAVDSDIRRLQCMERRFRLQSLRGDIPGALALGERLYPLAEAAGAHRIQGSVLMHLANTCYAHGLFVKMEDYARRAVEVTDRYGLNDLAVTPRTNLIFNHARLRNFEEAHRLLRECEQFEEWMTLTQQIQVLIANANISKLQKRYGDEEVLYQQCIVLARADDNPIAECAASNNLAGFYLRRRDPEHAIPLLQRSMAIGERIDYHSGPVAEMYFGHALVLMGQLDQARRILHQAMAVFTRRQNYKRMVDTQTVLLMCATADGDLHEMQRRVDVICGLFDRYNVVGFQYIDWIADRLQEMGLSDQAKPILAPLYE